MTFSNQFSFNLRLVPTFNTILCLKFAFVFLGWPTDGRTDRRVQGGLLPVRQGRRRHHHHQGAWHRHEVARTEPDRGGVAGHDQRGGRRRWEKKARNQRENVAIFNEEIRLSLTAVAAVVVEVIAVPPGSSGSVTASVTVAAVFVVPSAMKRNVA